MARGGWGHWAAPQHAPLPLLLLGAGSSSSSSEVARQALQLGKGREGAPPGNPALLQPCSDSDGSSSTPALAELQEFVRQCQQERLPRALHLEGTAREAGAAA